MSLAAFVVGAALALAPAALAASWTIQPTPSLPGSSSAGMQGVSCPSATWCAGVGYYTNSSGADVTLAEASNGTNWSVQSTPNPTGTSESFLTGVDCTAINVCTAVGHYYNGSSMSVPFAEARNGASWSLQSAPNPAGSAGSELIGVSCWSPTGCIAVGARKNAAGDQFTLAELWNGTAWTIMTTPNPSGATSSVLDAVSCTASTSCFGVGDSRSGTTDRALAEHWNGSTWTISPVAAPAGATQSSLSGVSCTAATACKAVGQYTTSASAALTLVESLSGTSWSPQSSPNPTGATQSLLRGISCSSASACNAVGEELTSAHAYVTLAEGWSGSSWSATATPNPAGAAGAYLNGVSCLSATACVAVGGDNTSSGTQLTLAEQYAPPLTFTQSWSGPTELTGVAQSAMRAVTCVSATECVTVGDGAEEATFNPVATSGLHAKPLSSAGLSGVPALEAVACPSATQCTALGNQGDMVTFNPSTEAVVKAKNIEHPSTNGFYDVACPSTSLCVAGDVGGYMFKFDPTTGTLPAPKKLFDGSGAAFNGIACAPGGTQCTATNQVGIEYTFNPTVSPLPKPNRATITAGNTDPLESIACPSSTVCIAGDESGNELSFNASSAGPKGTVKIHALDPNNELFGMDCLSTMFCATIDSSGKVFEGPPNTTNWHSAQIPGFPSTDSVACATTTLCAAVDTSGELFIGAPAPTNTALPVISGSTVSGQTLSSTNGAWTSPYPLSFTRKWERCSATGTSCVAITGATATSYKLTAADVGHEITVQVTATDADHRTGQATAKPTAKVT